LPAALEIVETRPRPPGRAVALVVIANLLFFRGWASLGKIDIVASGTWQSFRSGGTKVIQPLRPGSYGQIHVSRRTTRHAGTS